MMGKICTLEIYMAFPLLFFSVSLSKPLNFISFLIRVAKIHSLLVFQLHGAARHLSLAQLLQDLNSQALFLLLCYAMDFVASKAR